MAESVTKRIGGLHTGSMNEKELLKLMLNLRGDVLTIATVLNNVAQAVQNIKTNCSNATVNINSLTALTDANLNVQR